MVIILEVAFALGLVIFVHELGHFAVAKWCGVKCEKFYLGFDIYGLKLWQVTNGAKPNTASAHLPLGGYVKMLGQDNFDPAEAYDEMQRAKLAAPVGSDLANYVENQVATSDQTDNGSETRARSGLRLHPPADRGRSHSRRRHHPGAVQCRPELIERTYECLRGAPRRSCISTTRPILAARVVFGLDKAGIIDIAVNAAAVSQVGADDAGTQRCATSTRRRASRGTEPDSRSRSAKR